VNADDDGGPGAPSKVDAGSICPIAGTGTDAAPPAVDTWNEVGGPFKALADLDGVKSVAAAPTVGMTIADQLTAVGLQWKTYQENFPIGSAFGIDDSNGTATNKTSLPGMTPAVPGSIMQLYAAKHNPFAYFKSVQDGADDANSWPM